MNTPGLGPFPIGGSPRVLWERLSALLGSHIDEQQRVLLLGMTGHLTAGAGDVTVRYLASRATLYVQEHVQHDGGGAGGATYDAANFVSSTEQDCRQERQQDVTVTRNGTDNYYLFLVPVFEYPDGTKVKYDGVGAEDRMIILELGS